MQCKPQNVMTSRGVVCDHTNQMITIRGYFLASPDAVSTKNRKKNYTVLHKYAMPPVDLQTCKLVILK